MEDIIRTAHAEVASDNSGGIAGYIPALAQVDPDQWDVAFCDVSGGITKAGASAGAIFALEGCQKALAYCVARTMRGDTVHQHVGFEATSGFNEIKLNDRNQPHNPFVNAGSIMVASLIEPEKDGAERFEAVMGFFRAAAAPGTLGFDQVLCDEEAATATRNKILAYCMQERGSYEGRPTEAQVHAHLELYFKLCSVTADASAVATIAATLANGGTNPVTGKKVFSEEIVRDCLVLMLSCGMYGSSGQWACEIGLPAMSGVSGCLMAVVPGVGGLGCFSPRLDGIGISVRGMAFCKKFAALTEHRHHTIRLVTTRE